MSFVSEEGEVNEVATTMTADIPVAASTKYSEQATYWLANPPGFADVEGFLAYDGVKQSGKTDSCFGVDISFQEAEIPEDWEVVTISAS